MTLYFRNHSIDTTCAIHEENLRNYQKFVVDKQPKPCLNTIGQCGNLTLNVEDFAKYLPVPETKNDIISKEVIDTLFDRGVQTGQTHKRTLSDATSSNGNSAKKFIFCQPKVGSVDSAASKLPSQSPDVSDPSKRNDNVGLFGLFNSNHIKRSVVRKGEAATTNFDVQERNRRVNFHGPVQQSIQQQNEQKCLPSSNAKLLFTLHDTDRTRKAAIEPDTNRNKYSFTTATEELHRQNLLKNGQNANQTPLFSYGKSTKTLGTRRSVHSKFVPIAPVKTMDYAQSTENCTSDSDIDPRLKNIEPKMIELIQNEIMHQSAAVGE